MKSSIKRKIDILMTLTILVLIAFGVTGQKLHEYAGALMLVLFVIHNILNFAWYGALIKGKYTPRRIWMSIINAGVIITILLQMYSGITMSRYAFSFLPVWSGAATARLIHISAAHWCYMFIGIHLGNHWSRIAAPVTRRLDNGNSNRKGNGDVNGSDNGNDNVNGNGDDNSNITGNGNGKSDVNANDNGNVKRNLLILGIVIGCIGLYNWITSDMIKYMFLMNRFYAFDDSANVILVFLKNLNIMSFFVIIGFMGMRLTGNMSSKN